jgi:uncharacterized protein (DUF1684 family)
MRTIPVSSICRSLLLLSLVAVVACGGPGNSSTGGDPSAPIAASWQEEDAKYRADLETKLTSDTGWLTIAGLAFLTKPETTVGSDRSNDVVLPGATPARLGTFVLTEDGHVSVRLEPKLNVTLLDGKAFTGGELKTDGQGAPDRIELGDVQLWVHESGERRAIRIRDRNSPLRQSFTGMKWYPIDPAYRVDAKYVAFDKPKKFAIPNLLGDIDRMEAPGQVTFTLNGTEQHLTPYIDGDELWFVFRDLTAGDTTYPAARFLYSPLPKDGNLVIDFNRAENPPCAFNPYATCPLPPPENRLQVRVEAGGRYESHQ